MEHVGLGKGRKMKKSKMTEGTSACCFELVHISMNSMEVCVLVKVHL